MDNIFEKSFLRSHHSRTLQSVEDLYMGFGDDDASGLVEGIVENALPENQSNTVFWGVNGFICFLLALACLWCCFSRKFLTRRPLDSDLQYQRSLNEREQQREQAKIDSPEKRTRKLKHSFQKHDVVMLVKKEDIVEAEENVKASSTEEKTNDDVEETDAINDDVDLEANSLSSEENTGHLKLKTGRLVPNCCAVCLGAYEEGDKAVWSSNPKCQHAFHEECVIGWLVKQQPETPCPCCRQEFTDLEQVRKERKIKWAPSDAMNFNAVSLR